MNDVGESASAAPPMPDQDTEHQDASAPSLEAALARTQIAADAALESAAQLTRVLRRLRGAALVGNLRDLRATLGSVGQAAEGAREAATAASASWDLDEEAYVGSPRFTEELLATARAAGLQLFERDERLYCYPVLVRVSANDRAVFVDRTRERRIRPSVLIEHLRDVQRRPPRFRSEAFLESLFRAYEYLVKQHGPNQLDAGHSERLVDVYDLLTLMPGTARDYSRQEFARDIYLLDRSGVTTARRGYVVSLPASTGARQAGTSLRVVTESGQEKVYYGILFSPGR
jgi:hypothetical protein